jgi:Concanavalin A-like lectin/glucanases superfamily
MAVGSPVHFDGTNDVLLHSAALTGLADGKIFLFSTWFRITTIDTQRRFITIDTSATSRFHIIFRVTNLLETTGRNSAGTSIMSAVSTGTITDNNWHHLLISIDLASTSNRAVLLDGSDLSVTWSPYTNDLINFAPSVSPRTTVGGLGFTNRWAGDLAEFFFDTPATWFDPAAGGNLAKFISGGAPVDLGSDGSIPLGAAPIIFMSGTTANWHTNKGAGGGFTEDGALTDGAVPLPTAGAVYTQTAFRLFNDDSQGGLGAPP